MENSTSLVPVPANSAALATYNDIERTARSIAASKMFGMQTPDQALVLMLLCQSEGKNPIQAVRQYHIINGRPTMRADAMQAEFQARGGGIVFHERTDDVCDATFTNGATEARVTWTYKDATNAGLTQKPGPWKQFPRAMLHARCVSEGVRAVMPAVVAGIYTPEEVAQFDAPLQLPAGEPSADRSARPAPTPRQTDSDVIEGEIIPDRAQRLPASPQGPVSDGPKPMAPLFGEQKRFFDGALVLNLDVAQANDKTKPQKAKVLALFSEISEFVKFTLNPEVPADWRTAHDSLPAYSEHLRTQKAKASQTLPPLDEDEDPFAEDAPAGAAMAGNAIASGL